MECSVHRARNMSGTSECLNHQLPCRGRKSIAFLGSVRSWNCCACLRTKWFLELTMRISCDLSHTPKKRNNQTNITFKQPASPLPPDHLTLRILPSHRLRSERNMEVVQYPPLYQWCSANAFDKLRARGTKHVEQVFLLPLVDRDRRVT